MSVDNRTIINDCEANTGWTGDDTASPNTDAGQFYQGSTSLSTQLSNADEQMHTTEDSVGGGTFSLDWSDATLYLLVKDNLQQAYANGGVQFVIGDAADLIGYDVGGNDARGLPLPTYFACFKLDVSVVVAAPGAHTAFAGSEASLDQTAITRIGYGTIHLAKAVGSVDNAFMDCFRYIANGSFALTINGGTSGTPETMADVVGDDVTNGWGMVANPLGSQYLFFAPTEWGEASPNADHYFAASDEQWFLLGDNAGGRAVGAGNFPFRLVSNGTDTGSFVLTNVVIVNTGTRAQFSMDDPDFDTIELTGCSLIGLGPIALPAAGGTSRFTRRCAFIGCAQITHNGADATGSSVLQSAAATNEGALLYNEAADPDGELDGMSFSQGANAHHAIEFGADIPSEITLRDMDFSGFSSSDDADGSIFKFLDTGGTITLNLVNCTHDGSGFTVDARAGVTVVVVIDPVTALVHVEDENAANLAGARVYLKAADDTGPMPFEESVSISRSGTTATVSHTAHGMEDGDKVVIKGITDKVEDNHGTHTIAVTGPDAYTYPTTDSGSTSYTGSIIATWVAIDEDTAASGNASRTKSYTGDQPVTGRVRKSTSGTRYATADLDGTIDASAGVTFNVQLRPDQD